MARPKVRLYLQAMRQQLPYKARPQIYAKAFRNNSRFSKIWSIRRFFIFSTKKSGLVYRIGASSLPPAISLPRPQARQYTDSLPCWTQPQARSTVPCGKRRVKKRDLPHLGQISSAQPLFPCSAIKGPNLWVIGVVTRPFPSHIPVSCLRYYAPNPTSLPLMSGCDPSSNRNGKSKNRVICIVLASLSLLLFWCRASLHFSPYVGLPSPMQIWISQYLVISLKTST